MLKFASISLLCRLLAAKTPIFLPFFGLRHLVVSPVGGNLRKFNIGAQLQIWLSNFIKIVSLLHRLHGEIGRINSDVQKRDKQTDKQTDKNTWHGDRGPRARSCTSKTFGGLMHSFAARGAENLGITRHRQIKTAITP